MRIREIPMIKYRLNYQAFYYNFFSYHLGHLRVAVKDLEYRFTLFSINQLNQFFLERELIVKQTSSEKNKLKYSNTEGR